MSSKRTDNMIRQAALSTGPLTNVHKMIDHMKSQGYRDIPMPGHIGRRIQQLGVARKTERRIRISTDRDHLVCEYEVIS